MKLMLRAVNIMEHAQTSTKKERKEAHRCVHYLVHIQVAAAESGKILACARSRRCMVLLQTGLLAGSGGVACVEEHAPESLVMRGKAEGAWYSCKQGYLLEAVVLLVWRNMHPRAW
jgi:hypothetical protein